MRKRKRSGSLETSVTVRDKKTGVIQKQKVKAKPVKQLGDGEYVGYVRQAASIKLSLQWNSVMVECAIEMPYAGAPDDVEAAEAALDVVEGVIEKRMATGIEDAKSLLTELSDK